MYMIQEYLIRGQQDACFVSLKICEYNLLADNIIMFAEHIKRVIKKARHDGESSFTTNLTMMDCLICCQFAHYMPLFQTQ